MSEKLKIGVIGCGGIVQRMHLPYLWKLPQYEITAICDISQEVINGVGDQYGLNNRYTDYWEMVKRPDLDAVFVATHNHAEPTIAALNAGKHVMTEKPIAFNLELADQMILAARENKRKLMIAYNRRYDPSFEYALPLLRNMQSPKLIRVHDFGGSFEVAREIMGIYSGSDVSGAMIEAAKTKSRNEALVAIGQDRKALVNNYISLIQLCSHDANLLLETFGPPDQILHVETSPENGFVLATLEYANGDRCIWETGLFTGRSDWDQQFSGFNDVCRIEINFNYPWLKNLPTELTIRQMEGKQYVKKQIIASFDEAFKREWNHFYECLNNDMEPVTSGVKARADVEFLIGLIKAAKNKIT